MRFTYDGYVDKSEKTPCAWARRNGTKTEYGIRNVPISAIASMSIRKDVSEPHSLVDAMTLLYNVSLGQRTTTPTFQNKFIDRFAKTFFSDTYRLSMSPRTDSIINISSFANYFHMRRWNAEYGVIEPLYDEYRVLQGNIARWLQDPEGRFDATRRIDGTIPANRTVAYDERLVRNVAELLADDDAAIAFVEGVFMTCCWRDHSDTDKDLKNTKLREAIDVMKEEHLKVPMDSPKQFFSRENIRRLIKIGKSPASIYYVLEDSDEIIDLLAFDPSEYGVPDATGVVKKKKPRKQTKRKPVNANDTWDATIPMAVAPEDAAKWKKASKKAGGPVYRECLASQNDDPKANSSEWPTDPVVKISYLTPEELEQARLEVEQARRARHPEYDRTADSDENETGHEVENEVENASADDSASPLAAEISAPPQTEDAPKHKRRTRRGGKKNREKRLRQQNGGER